MKNLTFKIKQFFDTIVALATPPVWPSALAIIRISGQNVHLIINKIINHKITKEKQKFFYRNILLSNNKVVDDVIILSYVLPNSFTGEDMIEICCHGNEFIVNEIMNLIKKHGARHAHKGEFSQRAVLNNKFSLLQANSLNEYIHSKSLFSNQIYRNSFDTNKRYDRIKKLKNYLWDFIVYLEQQIDYPEIDEHLWQEKILKKLKHIKKLIISWQKNYYQLNMFNNGVNVVIAGATNVGKSSLFNQLLQQNKAIVSKIHGTTRDSIWQRATIDQFTINLIDTAGIRETKSYLEKIAIKIAKEHITNCNLLIWVFDGHQQEEQKIPNWVIKNIPQQNLLIVNNKSDLLNKNQQKIKQNCISCKLGEIDSVYQWIKKQLHQLVTLDNITIVSENENELIKTTIFVLEKIIKLINSYIGPEIIIIELEKIFANCKFLLGENYDEDLLNDMFNKFCLGK